MYFYYRQYIILLVHIMELSNHLSDEYEHTYYKTNENNEDAIIHKREYYEIEHLISGGDALSLDNLEVETYVGKI